MQNFRTLWLTLILATQPLTEASAEDAPRWWKGNTHTHSWWSDGDAPPEVIARWYKDHDYQFLVISDHNIMQEGEKWYPIDQPPRRPEAVVEAYRIYVETFSSSWVETRGEPGKREVRLKTLDEFRSLFEEPERFIFIRGEEITDRFERHPVHLNGVNLVDLVEPQSGSSITETIQNNLDAVFAQSKQYGQPMLVHLNHPNFHYAQTAEDFFQLRHEAGDGFFEMYNGHSGVNNHGDESHQSTERMWDIVLSKRLGEFDKSVIYGVATDDAHEHTHWGLGHTNPGRGWIMVRSQYLTPNEITRAIKRGDFYNSTGVELARLSVTDAEIDLEIAAEDGIFYQIDFIGTRRNADLTPRDRDSAQNPVQTGEQDHRSGNIYSEDIGNILKTVRGTRATYRATGDELYVRARVKSSKKHPNPFAEGDYEMAWTQPLVVVVANDQVVPEVNH